MMKKLLFTGFMTLFLGSAVLFGGTKGISTARAAAAELNLNCKSAYCMDADSATQSYAFNEKERLPIASMCKIMTLILSFDAIDE
ncbi:MAG: D-alanyl-D-alanine carboxypeptidase, partial [Clostridia bacterium]|nr:D-alanyl-D-alanine carboxypeptidase [Clostridia bacterium]